MKVTQDEIVDRQAVLNIEVDAGFLEKHIERAYRRLVGRVNVPGFRRGKAPRMVFERAYGRDRLLDEAFETMVPAAIADAIKESDLEVGDAPRVSVLEREPLPRLTATVPLVPVVNLGDYRSLRIDEPAEEVSDEDVGEVLERMREAQATWAPVQRPVEIGDMVILSAVEGSAAGKTIVSAKDVEYVVARDSTNPVPGFATELVGLEEGGTKQFSLILPDDLSDEDVAGETASFTVTVAEIKQKIVPALDDEFAAGAGRGCKTLDELRARVRAELEEDADAYRKRQIQEKALEAVVESSTVEVAPVIIEHEASHVIDERRQVLTRLRIPAQDYMARSGKSDDEVIEEARQTALIRLRRALVLEEVAQAEKIEVSGELVDEEMAALKQKARTPDEAASYDGDEARESVVSMLRRRLTLERLGEIVGEGPAGEADATGESEGADAGEEGQPPGEPAATRTATSGSNTG